MSDTNNIGKPMTESEGLMFCLRDKIQASIEWSIAVCGDASIMSEILYEILNDANEVMNKMYEEKGGTP